MAAGTHQHMVMAMRLIAKLCLAASIIWGASAWAVVRTTTVEWDYDPVGFAAGVPCIIRVYVGPAFAGAAYDNLVEGVVSTMTISYDLPAGRYSAVATAEVGKGPMWTANTAYTAGTIVVPRSYSMLLGDVYYTAATDGTSGATEPPWNNADGTSFVDGTVTWTVHNVTPRQWSAATTYTAGDLIAPPISAGLPGWMVFRCYSPGVSGSTEPNWAAAITNKQPSMQWNRQWRMAAFNYITDGTVQWTAEWRGSSGSVSGQSNRFVLQLDDDNSNATTTTTGRRWN